MARQVEKHLTFGRNIPSEHPEVFMYSIYIYISLMPRGVRWEIFVLISAISFLTGENHLFKGEKAQNVQLFDNTDHFRTITSLKSSKLHKMHEM